MSSATPLEIFSDFKYGQSVPRSTDIYQQEVSLRSFAFLRLCMPAHPGYLSLAFI